MKAHLIGLSLTTLLLMVAGCGTYDRTGGLPPLQITVRTPEHITLKAEGSPGQRFSVVLTVDGVRRAVFGVTPTEFDLNCFLLAGEVTRVEGDGSFIFVIERQNGTGRFYTPPVKNLRSFRYYDGEIWLAQK
jgi:hypothetical protein